MGLNEFLAGLKPESVDEGFDILEGVYKTSIKGLSVNPANQYVETDHYKLELEIVEVLDGNGNPGRTLRRNYPKDESEKGVGKLVNELFTAGIELPTVSVDELEASFETQKGKTMYVRAWPFTPKDAPDRKMQMWAVKQEKNLKKLIEQKAANGRPF